MNKQSEEHHLDFEKLKSLMPRQMASAFSDWVAQERHQAYARFAESLKKDERLSTGTCETFCSCDAVELIDHIYHQLTGGGEK